MELVLLIWLGGSMEKFGELTVALAGILIGCSILGIFASFEKWIICCPVDGEHLQ